MLALLSPLQMHLSGSSYWYKQFLFPRLPTAEYTLTSQLYLRLFSPLRFHRCVQGFSLCTPSSLHSPVWGFFTCSLWWITHMPWNVHSCAHSICECHLRACPWVSPAVYTYTVRGVQALLKRCTAACLPLSAALGMGEPLKVKSPLAQVHTSPAVLRTALGLPSKHLKCLALVGAQQMLIPFSTFIWTTVWVRVSSRPLRLLYEIS